MDPIKIETITLGLLVSVLLLVVARYRRRAGPGSGSAEVDRGRVGHRDHRAGD